jgi:hypothetical protein
LQWYNISLGGYGIKHRGAEPEGGLTEDSRIDYPLDTARNLSLALVAAGRITSPQYRDLLFIQIIELVNQLIDLLVGGLDATL